MAIVLALILTLVGMSQAVSAQDETYRFDIGAGIGMSGYLGDANSGNVYRHPGVALNGSFRYLIDNRWAVRGLLTAASLSGDSSDLDNVYPGGEHYKFKSWVYDLGARCEFNFFPYGIGETYKRLKRWTPYLSLGVGCAMSSVEDGTFVAATLPMGFGFKYKAAKRVNLSVEFTMTKAFGDHLDSKILSDLYGIKSSFMKNTDWYSTLMLSVSYEFGPRCVVCNRID